MLVMAACGMVSASHGVHESLTWFQSDGRVNIWDSL